MNTTRHLLASHILIIQDGPVKLCLYLIYHGVSAHKAKDVYCHISFLSTVLTDIDSTLSILNCPKLPRYAHANSFTSRPVIQNKLDAQLHSKALCSNHVVGTIN